MAELDRTQVIWLQSDYIVDSQRRSPPREPGSLPMGTDTEHSWLSKADCFPYLFVPAFLGIWIQAWLSVLRKGFWCSITLDNVGKLYERSEAEATSVPCFLVAFWSAASPQGDGFSEHLFLTPLVTESDYDVVPSTLTHLTKAHRTQWLSPAGYLASVEARLYWEGQAF